MWDFEHPPLDEALAKRYIVDRMTPAECAARLADGRADIGLIPIASLATTPGLRILPGCTIASKGKVRSLILVHRAEAVAEQAALSGGGFGEQDDACIRAHDVSQMGQCRGSVLADGG